MTPIQAVMFGTLIAMVLVWFACIRRLARHLRERHGETYDELELDQVWPKGPGGWLRGFDNSRPVMALLRFLWRREYRDLADDKVTRLCSFMRGFFIAYLILFGCVLVSFTRQIYSDRADAAADRAAVAATSVVPEGDRLDRAYDFHRALKWPEAIAAYDALLRERGDDAEILYWRGMAHWKSAHFDEAYRDFRRVIDLDPANLDAHRNADRLLSRQKKWGEILTMWNWYISRQPPNAEAYFERGGTFFHKGDMASARADAAKACELGKVQGCRMVERLKGQ